MQCRAAGYILQLCDHTGYISIYYLRICVTGSKVLSLTLQCNTHWGLGPHVGGSILDAARELRASTFVMDKFKLVYSNINSIAVYRHV